MSITSGELKERLSGFTGSDSFYRHPLARGFVYTEGVKAFADSAGTGGAHWLLDILATEPDIIRGVKRSGFASVKLVVTGQQTATLYVSEDWDNGPVDILYKRELTYTDAQEGTWSMYLSFDGENIICQLPSEY